MVCAIGDNSLNISRDAPPNTAGPLVDAGSKGGMGSKYDRNENLDQQKRMTQKLLGLKIERLRSLFQERKLAELWKLNENERKKRFVDFMNVSTEDSIKRCINRRFYQEVYQQKSFLRLSLLSVFPACLGYLRRIINVLQRLLLGRKYISAYRDTGAFMERMVRPLVAIQEILKGKNISLSEIKKYKTSNNIQRLKADRKFRTLLSPFNIVVWNGSRHPGVVIMPSTREVKFTDNQKSVTWKYETLKKQTCELYATTYILSHFADSLNLYIMQNLLKS
jgi:hypothetical protein